MHCDVDAQSSRFIFPLEEPAREWCLRGEAGREVDKPALLILSRVGSNTVLVPSLFSSSNLGV